MSTRETYKHELEMLLDGGHSPYDVLDMLAEVCLEKGEHVRSTWQDEKLAKAWERAGHTIEKAGAKLEGFAP